jgi:alpha-amylase/alpha-mannosidase (GH57 family)
MTVPWLVVHGHFYQPPRENPWLEEVPVQDAAAPYHDWNERVTAECYARNAAARILDAHNRIVRLVNTYARISFDVGPTLLRWLARRAPEVYGAVLEADRISRQAHFGHGNALAHPYVHLILPLASPRDRRTQIRWGLRDFERRFRRRPEGLWLPETAVDIPTLEALAEHRVAFTILSPHQARRVRAGPDSPWRSVDETEVDWTVPYRCRLPDGRSIVVFFFDPATSRAVAFEGLLHDGEAFARRLASPLTPADGRRIRVVATDGETYGHHHPFGEMALAYALQRLAVGGDVRLTNLAAYLAVHPPTQEVEIREGTSWSCPHGLGRWRTECGCRIRAGTHQRWRAPLREAIAWLAERLDRLYEEHAGRVLRDPWAARDDAVDLVDPDPGAADAFFARHGIHPQDSAARRQARRLLEMQRQCMLMHSSDGWFFDDIVGPEAVQVLTHAARAIDLAAAWDPQLEGEFVHRLAAAPSNAAEYPDGAAVYRALVRPQAVSTARAAAVYATVSLVEDPPQVDTPALTVRPLTTVRSASGGRTVLAGRVRVQWTLTEDSEDATYALVHFGGHEVHCVVRTALEPDRADALVADLRRRCETDSLSDLLRAVDAALGPAAFTLRDLPLDHRRRVLAALTAPPLQALEETYRRVYQDTRGLMAYLRDAQAPVPAPMVMAAVAALTRELEETLAGPPTRPLPERAAALVTELRSWGREVRADRFEPLLRRRLQAVLAGPLPPRERLERAREVLDLADLAGVTLDLWDAQNRLVRLARALPADCAPLLREVGERMHINTDALLAGADA